MKIKASTSQSLNRGSNPTPNIEKEVDFTWHIIMLTCDSIAYNILEGHYQFGLSDNQENSSGNFTLPLYTTSDSLCTITTITVITTPSLTEIEDTNFKSI